MRIAIVASTRRGAVAAGLSVASLMTACAPAAVHSKTSSHGRVWSGPVTLARCSLAQAPQVVFPLSTPFRRTGPGAIVFSAGASCPAGAGPRIAAIAQDDVPAQAHPAKTAADRPVALTRTSGVAATAHGQILILGTAGTSGSLPKALFSEGPAGGPFTPAKPLGGPSEPLGLATAYLGDVAIAAPAGARGGGVRVRIQHYYASRSATPTTLRGPSGAQRALTVALDYRTDALAVWWQHGRLYARERRTNGTIAPLQRFATAGRDIEIAALISDDGRGIVAWMDRHPHSARLYLDISGPDMRFGRPRLLERLRFPHEGPPPDGSLRLVRLSTESVLAAWTGTREGRYVVRAARIGLNGPRTTSTISTPDGDAVLLALATGPRGDAVALWTQAPSASAGRKSALQRIMAARGVPSSRGAIRFGAPELLTPPGRYTGASVAIDPDSDRAVASWREQSGAIRYALRAAPR
jgi:hypothetical protein